MQSTFVRRLLYVALFVLGFSLAAALMMALLVNYAWPRHLRDEEERESLP